jgi:hypothetical protein
MEQDFMISFLRAYVSLNQTQAPLTHLLLLLIILLANCAISLHFLRVIYVEV